MVLVEEGLVVIFGIKVGDDLVFLVVGVEKCVCVSNLCKLDWDLMCVNFFVLMLFGVIEDVLVSYIISFYL